jgi:laminin alpha 3/5
LILLFVLKVVFGLSGRKVHLVVDGLRAQEGSLPGNSTISPREQVYLGLSPSRKSKVKLEN